MQTSAESTPDHSISDKFSNTFDGKFGETGPTRTIDSSTQGSSKGVALGSPGSSWNLGGGDRVTSLRRKVMTLALSSSQKKKEEAIFKKASPNRSFYPEGSREAASTGAPLESFNVYRKKGSEFVFDSSSPPKPKPASPTPRFLGKPHLPFLQKDQRSPQTLDRSLRGAGQTSLRSLDQRVGSDTSIHQLVSDRPIHRRAPSDFLLATENAGFATSNSNRLVRPLAATSLTKNRTNSPQIFKQLFRKPSERSVNCSFKTPGSRVPGSPGVVLGRPEGVSGQRSPCPFGPKQSPQPFKAQGVQLPWSRRPGPSALTSAKNDVFSVYRTKNGAKSGQSARLM